jgi:hypothetical protein
MLSLNFFVTNRATKISIFAVQTTKQNTFFVDDCKSADCEMCCSGVIVGANSFGKTIRKKNRQEGQKGAKMLRNRP